MGTIAAVGSLASGGTFSNPVASLSFTATNLTDAVFVGVHVYTPSFVVSSITTAGTGVIGSWAKLAQDDGGDSGGEDIEIWWGIVTTTGNCTIEVTLSGNSAPDVLAQEFSSSTGEWSVDGSQGTPITTTGANQINFPSLTPTATNEMYIGFVGSQDYAAVVANLTSGYTVESYSKTAFIFNANVAESAQTPSYDQADPYAYDTIAILIGTGSGGPSLPGAPQSLVVTPSNTTNVLTWDAPSSAGTDSITNYKVSRGTTSGSETLLTTVGNVLTYTDSAVTAGDTYYYEVAAVTGIGTGPESNQASGTPGPALIVAVGTFASSYTTSASVSLSFTAVNLTDAVFVGVHTFQAPSAGVVSSITTTGTGVIGSWSRLVQYSGDSGGDDEIWYGIVTTTGSCDIVVNMSGSVTLDVLAQEFSSSTGAWYIDGAQETETTTGANQVNFASLTPIAAREMYIGLVGSQSNVSVVANLTTGYTVEVGSSGLTAFCFDADVPPTAQSPIWDQVHPYAYDTVAILMSAAVISAPPGAPTGLTVAPTGNSNVLTWVQPSNQGSTPITNYKVYKGTTSGSETLLTTIGDVLTYTDSAITAEDTYYYKVAAVNSTGTGPMSNEAGGIFTPPPTTELLVNANSATITSGGTTAPSALTAETWTVTASNWPVLAANQQFRVIDKVDLGKTSGYEIMLVGANANGTGVTWTANRGAEGTTPYSHASGWTAVPAGTAGAITEQAFQVTDMYWVNDPAYATGGTVGIGNASADTTALTNAANAAKEAGSGIIMFPSGNFSINTWPTFSASSSEGPLLFAMRGMGKSLTVLNDYATSIASSLTVNNPNANVSTGGPGPWWGGFTLTGSSAGAGCHGIVWCDVTAVSFNDIGFYNYSGAGSGGFYAQNHFGWTEGLQFFGCNFQNNTNSIHCAVPLSTGYSSFDYWGFYGCGAVLLGTQSFWTDEISQGSVGGGSAGYTDHIGLKMFINMNCANSSPVFNMLGPSQWDAVWGVNAEWDGNNPVPWHLGGGSGYVNGSGTMKFLYFSSASTGNTWQLDGLHGDMEIPGGPDNGSGLTISGATATGIGINANLPSVAGTVATAPPTSATIQTALGNLTLGTAFHNTLSYDVWHTVYLAVTANTSLVVADGVGTTATPTQTTIITGTAATGIVPLRTRIPAGYYRLLSVSGTATDAITGQYLEAA